MLIIRKIVKDVGIQQAVQGRLTAHPEGLTIKRITAQADLSVYHVRNALKTLMRWNKVLRHNNLYMLIKDEHIG